METASNPHNEEGRLRSLRSYQLLDTLPEEDYDHLTAIAAQICGTKISLVSLVDSDRQWFKSHYGLSTEETPREFAFCAHAILNKDEPFIIPDARNDVRFYDNPFVVNDPNVIFYAGVPLVNEEGYALGTICVLDDKPKDLTEEQLNSLKYLSRQTMKLLELRKKNFLLNEVVDNLKSKNLALEQFAFVAAHDLKSPLHQISGFSDIIMRKHLNESDEKGKKMIQYVHQAAMKLGGLIDGLLNLSRVDSMIDEGKKHVETTEFFKHISSFYSTEEQVILEFKTLLPKLFINEVVITHILLNLISNAIKYNDKEETIVEIEIVKKPFYYHFFVQDNGPGIPKDQLEESVKVFSTLAEKDRFGRKGSGIGLAIVKSLVEKSGGKFSMSTPKGKGLLCEFFISID